MHLCCTAESFANLLEYPQFTADMKVEGAISVEELDPSTRAPLVSWSAKALMVEEPESYSGAWLRVLKGKKPIAITLKGCQLTVVSKRIADGMACFTFLHPQCLNVYVSKADVNELTDMVRYMSQFLPNASARIHEHAMGAVMLSKKRILDSVQKEEWDNTPTKSVAHRTKRASLFLTSGSEQGRSLSHADLAELTGRPTAPHKAPAPGADKTDGLQRRPLAPIGGSACNIPRGAPPVRLAPIDMDSVLRSEEIESLSYSQRRVLSLISARESVFFTGSAGTGKSHLLGLITRLLAGQRCAVTSTTGITALSIGGTTVMHWSGVGAEDDPGISESEALAKAVAKVRGTAELLLRWRTTSALVIDEVSMLSARLFTRLEAVARGVRNCELPFGGIQLIVCGDFLQVGAV